LFKLLTADSAGLFWPSRASGYQGLEITMTNHPNRSPANRKLAEAAGYYIREGSYQGTTDDRLGRWYVGHESEEFFRPYGAGYRTQGEAWAAAATAAAENAL